MDLRKIRLWLLRVIAGDMQVYINANVHKGVVYVSENDFFASNSTFISNRFFCETPELEERFHSSLRDHQALIKSKKANQ
jgi:hypothetical protein